MKKLCLLLVVIMSMTVAFGSFAAFADTAYGNVLTLEEAKTLALRNDVRYRLQDSYIQDAQEEYEEILKDSSKSSASSNVASRAASQISNRVQEENAAYSIRKAVLGKEDIRRTSDYEVTDCYYTVIEAQNSVTDLKTEVEQKKKSLEISQYKYGLSIITKASVNQAEEALASSQAAYNKAVLELEKCVLQLGKSIGEELDMLSIKLDTSISIPDISGLVLSDIKEDNLNSNLTYFNLREQYKLDEYELQLIQEKFDYYVVYKKSISKSVEEQFEEMLYNAQKAFDDAEYSYNEKLEDLEDAIKDQYDSLTDLYETYEDEKAELEEAKLEIYENRIKLQLGLITSSEFESSLAELSKLEHQLYSTMADIVRQYTEFTQYSK